LESNLNISFLGCSVDFAGCVGCWMVDVAKDGLLYSLVAAALMS